MYVDEIMRTNLITVSPDTTLVAARDLLNNKKIEHLLVTDKDQKLIGIVSDRDIRQNWASPATTLSTHELHYLLDKITVKMIMVKTVISVPVSTTVERAAFIMRQHDIKCLPVMRDDKLVGIITSGDVMGVLLDAIGLGDGQGEDSTRLSVFVRDRIGSLARITSLLSQAGINIQSMLFWALPGHPGILQMVIRVSVSDRDQAMKALAAGGVTAKNYYTEDLTPFLPKD
ncbi:MAG TPA: acetoin utilization protein AcuB [Desulfobulbaceae bacterium]|nr:acetoin utilization protein AcuB [Desulfobulbaceae bacterium]